MATDVQNGIEAEIRAYKKMENELEARDMGKWALLHGGQLIGTYETFDSAAVEAVTRFGRGPYLIRQVGARPVTLPASVTYFGSSG